MKVLFQTKEESKRSQEVMFLKLPPSERVVSFFIMLKKLRNFPSKASYDSRDNFIIELKPKND